MKNVYEYRIIKEENGLGDVRYTPQFKKVLELNLIQKIKGVKNDWKTTPYPPFSSNPKRLTNEEKLEEAKLSINYHKSYNVWTSEIIDIWPTLLTTI